MTCQHSSDTDHDVVITFINTSQCKFDLILIFSFRAALLLDLLLDYRSQHIFCNVIEGCVIHSRKKKVRIL